MLISKRIELVPIYVHSAIQRFVNTSNNKFSFTEEAYKNINQRSVGYLFIYSHIVKLSSPCIEINLSRNTKKLSPIDAGKQNRSFAQRTLITLCGWIYELYQAILYLLRYR